MAGAKQWRVECPHIADRPRETTMASEVTHNNKAHWAPENRVPAGVDARDLGELLASASGTVVVCNSCRRVIELADGSRNELAVHYGPDPHYTELGFPGDPYGGEH